MSSTAPRAPLSNPWIISRTQDLIWFQGSAFAGLALLVAFLALPRLDQGNYSVEHPAVWLLLFWGVIFDGTHVMATYARTYFASDDASKAALPGKRAFAWLLLGPLVAIADYFCCRARPSIVGSAGLMFGAFLSAAYLWAYYHLVRQHYGFLSLYRRKANANHTPTTIDAWFLWVGSAYPFLRFNFSETYKSSGLPVLLPDTWLEPMRSTLDFISISLMLGIAAIWCYRAAKKIEPLSPKHLFLLIVVGFSNLTFVLLDNLMIITAVLTIFHNLQYHRIVWQYERGQKRVPMGSVMRYAVFALALGLLWYGPRILGVASASSDLWRNILVGLGWGVAFHHYYVDARIWRVRRQPAVGQTLDRGAG
jgi:hypothetical protein